MLLAALALQLRGIQQQSIWFDEGWSAFAAAQPSLLGAAAADATNPPLYYMLLHAAVRGFGLSEFSLRFVSTLFGLLIIPLTYQLGRRVFDEWAGLFAAFLAVISPLLWWAAQEARMYTLMAVLVLLAALAWYQLIKQPKRWAWLLLWGAELALLYTHNTGPVVALWLNIMTPIAWDRYQTARRPDWQIWYAGQIAVGAAWLPYFVTRFLDLGAANSAVTSGPGLNLELLNQVWTAFWAGNWNLVGREALLTTFLSESPYIGLSGVALIIALWIIPFRRREDYLLIGHILVLLIGLIAGLMLLGNEFHGRYLVMIAPLLLVALGAGIARQRFALARIMLLGFFLVILANVLYLSQNPLYWHDDARGMAQYYADEFEADDTVLMWSYADRYDLRYYWDRLGVTANRVTLAEGSALDAVAPRLALLPEGGDVSVNVWYTQRADFRGMLGCLLAHGSPTVPEEFTTYGMTDRRYREVDLMLPELEPREIDFGVARVDRIGTLPNFGAAQTVCLPVEITLTQPTRGDLSAAVIVQNRLGWEIARADAIFAQSNQVLSSQLQPGATLTAFATLRLPYGAPRGEYRVFLRVYDETNPSGYEPQTVSRSRVGRDVLLGTWPARAADWTQVERESHLPVRVNVPVRQNLTLTRLGHNPAVPIPARGGDSVRLELLWRGSGNLPSLIFDAEDAEPAYEIDPENLTEGDGEAILDWRAVSIPADVEGSASLRVGNVVIARFTVETLPLLTDPPAFETAVDMEIPGIGTLAGYSLAAATANKTEPLPVTLVWQAGANSPAASYTVFVQLLDAGGTLLAQSDAIPAGGARPTTGWRAGEYIVDEHLLRFNETAADRRGQAYLIVGMYDAATGVRLLLADRSNAIRLPGDVTVE
jgi:uncharacterized membrane protein